MSQLTKFEDSYRTLINSLQSSIPDGIIHINLELLSSLNLMDSKSKVKEVDSPIHYSFEVNEGSDKLTLFNDKFVIWIVPQMIDLNPTTFTFIALNNKKEVSLELVFSTTGVYNSSKIVLSVLAHYLNEIHENESTLHNFKHLKS